jgi:flagellar protein FliO/FliZ
MESGMQFMTTLFGESGSTILNAMFSLGIVLVLIVLGLWGLKQLTRASDRMGRKMQRLSVVDTATVDGKRKVVIIRRDNVEHVIMTGGPQDLLIESGIAVPEPAPQQARRPAQAAPAQRADKVEPAPRPAQADAASTPAAPERPAQVSREQIDRLFDLARPAPLKPRTSLRHTGLLRPVSRQETDIIPIGPALRVDNSNGAATDSAKTGTVDPKGGTGVGGRNRFFRNARDRS